MKHKVVRSVLTILLAAVAVFDIAEAMLVLTGVRTPAVYYQGTQFADATIPMLLLAIVVGGSALLAAATTFIHRKWAVLVSVVAGLMMVGFLVVEIVSIDSKLGNALHTALAVQLFYLVLGLALSGLAGYLWMREYRSSRHFHLWHVTTKEAQSR
jgi:intracellular septation protein A